MRYIYIYREREVCKIPEDCKVNFVDEGSCSECEAEWDAWPSMEPSVEKQALPLKSIILKKKAVLQYLIIPEEIRYYRFF